MRILFTSIFLLTIVDATATSTGIARGYLDEANPLARAIMLSNPFAAGIALCLLTGLLLSIAYSLRKRVSWLKYAMVGVLAVKTAIVLLHFAYVLKAIDSGYNLLFFVRIG